MDAGREERWRDGMIAAQAGDCAAYEKLLHELLPHVGRLVRQRLFDPTAVEDVVQNVFVSLHRARHTYRAERPFLPWLNAIVRNAAIDSMREVRRRRQREIPLEQKGVPEPATSDAPIRDQELDPSLRKALAKLPAPQREAVLLIHLTGLSVAEAAMKVGISPGALKVRAHRGYRALRAILEEEGA